MLLVSLQRGLSLIEVLIALAVFSIGLLGAARLVAEQGQLEQESGYRAAATLMAEDLLERIRVDGDSRTRYLGAFDFPDPAAGGNGSDTTVVDGLRDWASIWAGRYLLPSARVCARKTPDGANQNGKVEVTVVWRVRVEMTPPGTVPDCVKDREPAGVQRWVALSTWVHAP